ncbi:Heavy metal transport/detoxification superfamily protein [Striga hermonthica]|uniref:Heavy metal transport/detoxification superfamily protein n=1 Tax=Striga hermonthica TaxID=68872 RepID=A0A9N7MU92_STRHE|nr:Heavy metal transport/detoxification superfamily protein [Striga hermonthica]
MRKNSINQQKSKDDNNSNFTTVILRADLHCEGCVSKVLKCIRSFSGVKKASIGDGQQITVVGKVDPARLCEKLEKKTHKRIEIISPSNDKEGIKENDENGGKEGKPGKKNEIKGKNSNVKNTKEKLPVTTAVLKVHLHCHGCTRKIYKLVTKTKGYEDMKMDKVKELVTVRGAMDMSALANSLKKHLKREVQILPQPEKKDNSDKVINKVQKEKEKEKEKEKGGVSKTTSGAGAGEKAVPSGPEKTEGNNNAKSQVGPVVSGSGFVVEQFHYNPCEFGSHHAPQIFSDENPNACCVM